MPLLSSRRSDSIEITPLGDSALIVRVHDKVENAREDSANEVLGAMGRIEEAKIAGIVELAPAYATIGVFFDPGKVIASGIEPDLVSKWLSDKIHEALSQRRRHKADVRLIEVPACFDSEFAVDLERVASVSERPTSEVVDHYCAAEYRVACIGFTPGFPYLVGLPKELTTPRRATPRTEIPAGSVAIGGNQTGVYPLPSPGGWNVIGRTPLRLFDPTKDPPAFLRPGDKVRFRAVTRDEFERSTS